MTASLVSLNADSRSTPNRGASVFTVSDGSVIAIWAEGKNGPGTDRVIRRYRSPDGINWYRLADVSVVLSTFTDPVDGSKQIYPVFGQSVPGSDTIACFNINPAANTSQMLTFTYSSVQKDFLADTLVGTYTATNAWDGLGQGAGTPARPGYTDYAKMVYDSADTDYILVFDALVATQEYIYLIIWDTATGKRTETRFTNAPNTTCRFPDVVVDQAVPRKIFLTYHRSGPEYRSWSWDGTTLTVVDTAEAIPGSPLMDGGVRCVLNSAGTLEVFYKDFDSWPVLKRRRRTGVATYSAATVIANYLPHGDYASIDGWQDMFNIVKGQTDDLWVFYKRTFDQFQGELYYVRRLGLTTWVGEFPFKLGASGLNHPATTPHAIQSSDHKLHMLFSRGAGVYPTSWALYYEALYDGTPTAPTEVTPNTAGEISATPRINAKYNQLKTGDTALEYQVIVERVSDSASMWDSGAQFLATPLTPGQYLADSELGGGVLYAGTALVKGIQYRVKVRFYDSDSVYAGDYSAFSTFSWNDQPMAAGVAVLSDPANGVMRQAMYPFAVPGILPASAELWRKLATDVLYDIRFSLGLVTPTVQNGFQGYRQLPEKIGRNLVINGGFQSGLHGWSINAATTSVVVDPTSVTGYAVRLVTETAGPYPGEYQDFPVEAGKAYSFALQCRSDGSKQIYGQISWLDAGGALIVGTPTAFITATAYTETALTNQVAPGNARTARVYVVLNGAAGGAGIGFATAMRFFQQTAASPAWTQAHQQYVSRGLEIYEASTNLTADGDMEAVGVASYTAVTATLTKDTGAGNFFAGAKGLKIVTSAIDGRAQQDIALAAGQPVTASVRVKGGDATTRLLIYTEPSNVLLATMNNPNTTDWNALRVSGTVAGGDTAIRAMLVGGGNAVTSYWDNFAVENKAYDTMNADPSGQAFALAARTVSNNQLPLPTGFDSSDLAFAMVLRFDHAYSRGGPDRYMVSYYVSATDMLLLFIGGGVAGTIGLTKYRTGVTSTVNDGGVTQWAAGDTLALGIKHNATDGLVLMVSKNGAAVATYTLATPEAKLPFVGTPTLHIGRYGGAAGNELDGTVGAYRSLKAALSNAQLSAFVLDPYQQPTDNDLAVWAFEGFTFAVPSHIDRFTKLGSSYDYRAVTRGAAFAPTPTTGQPTRGVVLASAIDAWWLRDGSDPTKDIQLYVRHDSGYEFERGRPMAIATPLQGGPRSVTYGATPFGDEGRLALIYPTAALRDATELALKALLASNNTTFLQDPFGGLRKIRISAPIRFRPSLTPADLESELDFIEVP